MVDVLLTQKTIPVPRWVPASMKLTESQENWHDQLVVKMEDLNAINQKIIPNIPVFEISNVFHYCKTRIIDPYKDWPCLMLPLDTIWMEYKRSDNRNPTHIGALLTVETGNFNSDDFEFLDKTKTVKHVLGATCYFMDKQRQHFYGPCATYTVVLNDQGAPIDFNLNAMNVPNDQGIDSQDLMLANMAPFFQAIAFMHCKNVRIETEKPDLGISKKWKKKTGKPLAKWNTLTIDPLRDTLSRDRRGTNNALSTPASLHIARGHFAEYGEEFGKGKLFGKYSGRYWIPQHVRGNKDQGTIGHDYVIGKKDD